MPMSVVTSIRSILRDARWQEKQPELASHRSTQSTSYLPTFRRSLPITNAPRAGTIVEGAPPCSP